MHGKVASTLRHRLPSVPPADFQSIHRRELAVLYLDVGLGQVHVHLRDFQRRVAQDQPQRHDVATVHQIAHRKGVAKQVKM